MNDINTEFIKWLDEQTITSENIGDIRRQCFVPWDSEWNGIVRDETASRENMKEKLIIDSTFIINKILPLIPNGSIITVVYEADGKHYNPVKFELTNGVHIGTIPIVYESDYNKLTCAEGSIFNNDMGSITQEGSEFQKWVKIGYYIVENKSHHQIHFTEESYNKSINTDIVKNYNHLMVEDFIKEINFTQTADPQIWAKDNLPKKK